MAARHGLDEAVLSRVPFAFYRKSMAAAFAILEARRTGGPAAEAEAVARAHALWAEHKLAPPDAPPPSPRPRRLPDGMTVLSPWLAAEGEAADGFLA